MKKILITGGPVYGPLDDVKIVTNRFKGGLMCDLTEKLLSFDTEIIYLCAKINSEKPKAPHIDRLKVIIHNGFDEYRKLVLELAPSMDAVILGAAVLNLVPAEPFKGKFPSHNYEEDEIVNIPHKITRRVINEVRAIMKPDAHLFGGKLLSKAPHEELIHAAYKTLLASRATAIIANDTRDLKQKYAVTKERGVHPMKQADLAGWIWDILQDEYYSTVTALHLRDEDNLKSVVDDAVSRVQHLIQANENRFTHTESGLIFGTAAVRCGKGFMTTGRGKREIDSFAQVVGVSHVYRQVHIVNAKASLNAPLLARIFENERVDHIVHYHEQVPNLPTYPYAPPGTVRDTNRPNHTSFNIAEHGCMLLFDKEGRML